MKYVTATFGALLIFAGAFLALMMLSGLVFPQLYSHVGGVVAAYAVGVPLAITAAVLSFRATLRHYAPKSPPPTERIHCPGCGETLAGSAEQCPLCGRVLSPRK